MSNFEFNEPGDDMDVDVCVCCGRYYGITPQLDQLWRKSIYYREGAVMDQLCYRCMGANVIDPR